MTTITRRQFGALTIGTLALPRLSAAQTVGGVRLGVQTYSFRDLPRAPGGDATASIIEGMKACGFTECELWADQIEPPRVRFGPNPTPEQQLQQRQNREALRTFRVQTPLDHFRKIGEAFRKAGLTIYAYNYSFANDFSDEEINRGFEIARAMRAEIITSSSSPDLAKRLAPFADRQKMTVAFHNHSAKNFDGRPGNFFTPEHFAAVLSASNHFKINLDIGHYTAANQDPIAYLRDHSRNVTNLHIKDRKKDEGPNTPWGTGDTPIREVLALLKREKSPIRAYIEYEHKGAAGPVEEVKKCLDYAKAALA